MNKYFNKEDFLISDLNRVLQEAGLKIEIDDSFDNAICSMAKDEVLHLMGKIERNNPFLEFPYLATLYNDNPSAARRLIYNEYRIRPLIKMYEVKCNSEYVKLDKEMNGRFKGLFNVTSYESIPNEVRERMYCAYQKSYDDIIEEWCKLNYNKYFWVIMKSTLNYYLMTPPELNNSKTEQEEIKQEE